MKDGNGYSLLWEEDSSTYKVRNPSGQVVAVLTDDTTHANAVLAAFNNQMEYFDLLRGLKFHRESIGSLLKTINEKMGV